MKCPEHKGVEMVKSDWHPFDGLDPLMTRHACLECTDYWYKAPKKHLRHWEEVQADLLSPSDSPSKRRKEERRTE